MSRKKRRRRPSSRPKTRRHPITLRDVGHADLLAVAAEHCETLAVRERDDDLEPVLLTIERHTDGRAGVLALVVGETRILLPERAFDDMVEIARVIRPIVELRRSACARGDAG